MGRKNRRHSSRIGGVPPQSPDCIQAQHAWEEDEEEDTQCGDSSDGADAAIESWDDGEEAPWLEENRRLSQALAEAEAKLLDLQDKQAKEARALREARSKNQKLSESLDEARRHSEARAEKKQEDAPPSPQDAEEAPSLQEERPGRLSHALKEAKKDLRDVRKQLAEEVRLSEQARREKERLSRALAKATADLETEARLSQKARREKDRLSRALAKARADLQAEERRASELSATADLEAEARFSQKARCEQDRLSQALAKAKADLQAEERRVGELSARVAKLEDKARVVANLATASLAQWFYDGDATNGQTLEHEFSRIGNQQVEELYQLNESAIVQLRLGKVTYAINFSEMTQRNTRTDTIRCIRRKVLGGTQCTDLLEKVRHTLEARSQEVVVARKEARVTLEELEKANWNLRVAGEQQQQHDGTVAELRMELRDAKEKLIDVLTSNALMDKQRREHTLAAAALTEDCQAAKRESAETAEKLRAARVELDEAMQHHTAALAAMHQETRRAFESWKARRSGWHLVAEPLALKVQEIFQQCSHQAASFQGIPSRCSAFQNLRVEEVRAAHHPHRFDPYNQHLSSMCAEHLRRGRAVRDVRVPASEKLASLFPGICLASNELLLVHGCTREAAMSIIENGFDLNLARPGRYGSGIYFAAEMCKSDQYARADPTGLKYMLVVRVALGDPAHLTEFYSGNLPPLRPDGSRYDSAIASPARVRSQSHAEFVVFKPEQAYPELLVTYRVPVTAG